MNAPRRLRWALRSFPRRFRAQRCTEIESTFQEAELAGEPNAYGAAALIDVVVAGWRERARTRPPLGPYLRYRLLDGRLDQRWHSWMFDDLDGWFPARRAAWWVSVLTVIWVVMWRVTGGLFAFPPWFVWPIWGVAFSLTAGLERRRILKRHGYDPHTRTWVPPVVVTWVPTPRRIRRAVPMLTGVAVALLLVTPFAAITLLVPERSLRSLTTGPSMFERVVDHTILLGWVAVAAGCTLLVVGIATRRWIAARVLVPADTVNPTRVVIVPAGTPGLVTPMAVAITGIASSALPVAPNRPPCRISRRRVCESSAAGNRTHRPPTRTPARRVGRSQRSGPRRTPTDGCDAP